MRNAAALALAAWAAAAPAHAFPDGAPWEAAGSQGCMQCHFDAPAVERSTAVTIEGLPERLAPGATYRLVVRLSAAGMAKAGFLLSAWQGGEPAGSFVSADERAAANAAQARSTEIGASVPSAGIAEWSIDWIAPREAGEPVTLEVWANAANDDASPFGDATHHRAWRVPMAEDGDERRGRTE